MIKTVIVEDEKKSQELLKKLVEKNFPQLQIVGTADGVETGIELIRNETPDLIFLDITMPDGTGFDVLEKVSDKKADIIFITASDKFAIKAIKYSALDYILKPVDIDELKAAVNKIIDKKSAPSNHDSLKFLLENIRRNDDQYSKISLHTGNAYEIVNVKDIIRCEADGNYTSFMLTNNRKFVVSTGLKYYEDILPQDSFIRIHHHHLININQVVRFLKEDGGYAIMSDNSKVEISRRKKDAFLQRLQKM